MNFEPKNYQESKNNSANYWQGEKLMPQKGLIGITLFLVTICSLLLTYSQDVYASQPHSSNFRAPLIGDFELTRIGRIEANGTYFYSTCTDHSGTRGSSFMDINVEGAGNDDAGTPIYASGSGDIQSAAHGWNGGFGNNVVLDTDEGVTFRYAHLAKIYVSTGQSIGEGQLIGLMGNTGRSFGAHLHWEGWMTSATSEHEPYKSLFSIPGVNVENDFATPCYGGDDGDISAPQLSTNPWNWCPTLGSESVSNVVLFDHKECKGNYVTIPVNDLGYHLWNVGMNFDNRTRSIYVPSWKSVFVVDNVWTENPRTACINGEMWNLDSPNDTYDNSTTRIGWQGGNGDNMISWVMAFDNNACEVNGMNVGGAIFNQQYVSMYEWQQQEDPNLLTEFSIAEHPPFEIEFHAVVEYTGGSDHYDAMQVCVGTVCNETSTTEMYWDWNSYDSPDGLYDLKVRYRTINDGGNWANADVIYEGDLFLSPIRKAYAPCGSGVDGVKLTSGSDCIIATQDAGSLADVGWSDRSDLNACVSGDQVAWLYEGVRDQYGNYTGSSYVVNSGECKDVGSNVSSLKLTDPMQDPVQLPDEPFSPQTLANTMALYHFDEMSGTSINDSSLNNLDGSISTNVNWTNGTFGGALDFNGVTSGSAATFPAISYCPMTFEAWARLDSGTTSTRLAGQLGGGSNTGSNKWLLSYDSGTPAFEVWWDTGSLLMESYKEVEVGEWHYLMATYNCLTKEAYLYINNELVAQGKTPSPWPSGVTTLEIGTSEQISHFDGAVDEVRIIGDDRKPLYQDLNVEITDPATGMVRSDVIWDGAKNDWQILDWDDGGDYGMQTPTNVESINHQYMTGTYTVTLDVIGEDNLTYTIQETVTIDDFECDQAATQSGVVLYEFKNCAYVTSSDYVELEQLGLYNLEDLGFDDMTSSLHFPQDGSMSARFYEGPDGTGSSFCRGWDHWDLSADTWPDSSSMDDSISSVEVFSGPGCVPPPQMTMDVEIADPHGQIKVDVTWSGASEGWQIVRVGDGNQTGWQGPSGSETFYHWYSATGDYTLEFEVENAEPNWEHYIITDTVTINGPWGCDSSAPHSGVVVYSFSDCSYRDASDYEQFEVSTGDYDLSNLDDAVTSIHIPSGQSVKLFKDSGQTGQEWCTSWDMWNMDLDEWPDQTAMNDTVSSIRIYNNTTCTE